MNNYDYLFKVVLVGDLSVGKSNLLSRYVRNEFSVTSISTIGVEFGVGFVTVAGKRVKLQIWDTSGQERYRAMQAAYYRGAIAILLVYDVTNQSSFDNCDYWLKEVRQRCDPDVFITLVGNKCDLDQQRQISTASGQAFADANGIYFLETSALNSTNVSCAFESIAFACLGVEPTMPTSLEPATTSAGQRLGSYDTFGLVYRYQNRVMQVPLRGVRVDANIVDFVVRTAITQHFYNSQSFAIEAVYVFPLDERSAVCGFEVDIDGEITKGVVQEKQQARQTYQRAVARGDGAQLLEQKRTDVFELSVGNLLPGQHAIVTIITVADLKIEEDDVRFFLPTFVAPRYHPSGSQDIVPSTGQLQVQDGLQIEVSCIMSQPITNIMSPTHPVAATLQPGSNTAKVALLAGTMQLDSDFVLLVRTVNPHEPRVCVEIGDDGSTATMITLAPQIQLDNQRCELIFIIDRSASMGGSRIEQARKAMNLFLRSLPTDCCFNIVGFGSSYGKLWASSAKYNAQTLQQGSAHIASMQADMGGTELLTPLQDVLNAKLISGYARQVFVLTDGEVSNTVEVMSLVRSKRASARVFALGLGHGASHELVEGIAKAGRGTAEFVINDRLETKVISQLSIAIQPALNDVTVEWDVPVDATYHDPSTQNVASNVPGAIGNLLNFRKAPNEKPLYSQAPFKVPVILSGSRFIIYCMAPLGHPTPTSATIRALTSEGPLAVRVSSRPEDYIVGEVIHKMAARAIIRDLEDGTSYEHSIGSVPQTVIQREIVRIGMQYQLTSSQTSYVAVQSRQPNEFHPIFVGPVTTTVTSAFSGRARFAAQSAPSGCAIRLDTSPNYSSKSAACCDMGWSESSSRSQPQIFEVETTTDPAPAPAPLSANPSLDEIQQNLTLLQDFFGWFALSENLARIIGKPLQTLRSEKMRIFGEAAIDDKVFATALAVAFFEAKLTHWQEEWKFVVSKARKWLVSANKTNLSLPELIAKCATLL